jgi:TonB family protein
VVRVRVDGGGRIASAAVEEPSGDALLDAAALQATREVPSLAPPPGGPVDVLVPFAFRLVAE